MTAMAAANQTDQNDGTLAVGCRGHQIDSEFPLESRTPFALPLVMYTLPVGVKGRRHHHEVDLCALPVLNWEAYIRDVKTSMTVSLPQMAPKYYGRKVRKKGRKTVANNQRDLELEEEEDDNSFSSSSDSSGSETDHEETIAVRRSKNKHKSQALDARMAEFDQKSNSKLMKLRHALMDSENVRNPEETEEERKIRFKQIHASFKRVAGEADHTKDNKNDKPSNNSFEYTVRELTRKKLPLISLAKLKNRPKLIIQATWNHMYGGLGGAGCFMKTGSSNKSFKKLYVFVGKGSQLRAVRLKAASRASMFNHTIDSVWEENPDDMPSNKRKSNGAEADPLSDLIFQLVPNNTSDILGVRRGKSIDLYNTEDDVPYYMESISNTLYGTEELYPESFPKSRTLELLTDPLLLGLDLNPTYIPECITIDENWVVRICDFTQGWGLQIKSTNSMYAIPREPTTKLNREDYPTFQLNSAAGVSFTHFGKMFYAWGNSVVYLGDRRCTSSSSDFVPLFDVQKSLHSQALTDQNFFHTNPVYLNEYISCMRKSKSRDTYYYVGTTSKIYLMDLRVPSHPVIKISHGLQSPPAYLDTYSNENFEILVGASQRVPETVALITDHAHVHCYDRPGCTAKNPVLHCYPRHLSNSRVFFDETMKTGNGFSMPIDHNHVKGRHYAWTTGLSIWPSRFENPKSPRGVVVVTTNNFGDIFYQEWDQKPIPSHKKTAADDTLIKTFTSKWKNAMTSKISLLDKTKSSRNTKTFVDCSLIMDTLAKEIEKLQGVRDAPFDCFKPHELQYQSNVKDMPSTAELISELRRYKGEKAQEMVDVWSELPRRSIVQSDSEEEQHIEQVEIKGEPQDMLWSPSSSVVSINDINESGNEELCSPSEMEEGTTDLQLIRSQRKQASSESETCQHSSEGELITGDINESEEEDVEDMGEIFENSQDFYQHSQAIPKPNLSMNVSDVEDDSSSFMPFEMEDKTQLFVNDYKRLMEDNPDSLQFETEMGYSQYHESTSDSQPFGLFPFCQDSQEPVASASGQSKRSSASYQWRKSSKGRKSGFL
ncbi:hypothetical protein Ocin01_01468 [Orchesella cincta]|uniref:Uncharacterized protein n=1 Tax=Orchesella cincta TaxID=48709 RepID=A0A1D2NJ09_ORCCI|nr:hypothetical protein Ocin01_01468 [Orchesella cincta]